jgi:hypothetical protein
VSLVEAIPWLRVEKGDAPMLSRAFSRAGVVLSVFPSFLSTAVIAQTTTVRVVNPPPLKVDVAMSVEWRPGEPW